METAELNRKIDALIDMATRTSQDVSWIKEGMERGTERMDSLAKDHADLNTRVSRMQGSAGTFGGGRGGLFCGVDAFFVNADTSGSMATCSPPASTSRVL